MHRGREEDELLEGVGGLEGVGAGLEGVGAAAGGASALTLAHRRKLCADEIKAHKDTAVKPKYMDPHVWEQKLSEFEQTCKVKHGLAPAPTPANVAAALHTADIQDAVADAWEVEAVFFKSLRVQGYFSEVKFGKALDRVHKDTRYAFWFTSHADKMPLHAFAPRGILGRRATATANEELHSVGAYITRKLRAKTSPDKLELLSLARKFAMETVSKNPLLLAAEKAAAKDGYLDIDAIDELMSENDE